MNSKRNINLEWNHYLSKKLECSPLLKNMFLNNKSIILNYKMSITCPSSKLIVTFYYSAHFFVLTYIWKIWFDNFISFYVVSANQIQSLENFCLVVCQVVRINKQAKKPWQQFCTKKKVHLMVFSQGGLNNQQGKNRVSKFSFVHYSVSFR